MDNILDTECYVLGAMVIGGEKAIAKVSHLQPEHFTDIRHRWLFGVLMALNADRTPTDIVTIHHYLVKRHGERGREAAVYADEIYNATPGAANIANYAKILVERHTERKTREIACTLSDNPTQEGAQDAMRALLALAQTDQAREHTMQQAVKAAWGEIESAFESGGKLRGITTGLPELDECLGGFHRGDLIIIGARPAMGKEQPNSALVLMEGGGWKRIGEIRVGDRIASIDGGESAVCGVYPQGIKDVYEFSFADGRTARAGIDHLWEVIYRDWEFPRIKTTAEILLMLGKARYKNRLSIRLVSGAFGKQNELPLDPWFLGILLGDGNFTTSTPRITSADACILDRIGSLLPSGYALKQCGKYDFRISGRKGAENWLAERLKALDLWGCYSHEKRIPAQYMTASQAQRLELLRGLIDSDGWVESFGAIRFCASSVEFANDVRQLAMSLGCICSIKEKQTSHRTAYVLNIRHSRPGGLCWLERKRERIRAKHCDLSLTIRAVEVAGREECTCIQVTHKSRLYVTDNYVVTHNTALLLSMAQAADAPRGFISAEQSSGQIGQRALSMASRIPVSSLRAGQIEEYEFSACSAAISQLSQQNCVIYDKPAPTLAEVVHVARRWKVERSIQILYVDYVQRIKHGNAKQPRHERVAEVAEGLKELARELDIPVVALAQVARAVDERPNKRPGMADLSDSSALEKEADQVLMLYRDEVYKPDSEYRGTAELILEKNRHGAIGMIRIAFNGPTVTFSGMGGMA